MREIIVTEDNWKKGLKVKPSSMFGFSSSQYGNSTYGIIKGKDTFSDRMVTVEWEYGERNCYYLDRDLALYDTSIIKPEYKKEALRFFKTNIASNITKEMLTEKNKTEWMITN